jgi:tetratricopeptide (TPR) repeat protein
MHTTHANKTDTGKINSLLRVAQYWTETKSDSTLKYSQKALSYSAKINYKDGISKATYLTGFSYLKKNRIKEATTEFEKYLQIGNANKDKSIIALAYFQLGNIQLKSNNMDKALNFYFIAIEKYDEAIRESTEDKAKYIRLIKEKKMAKTNISSIYSLIGENEKAKIHLYEMLEELEKIDAKETSIDLISSLSIIYSKEDDNQKALFYALKAKKLTEEKIFNAEKSGKLNEIVRTKKDYSTLLMNIAYIYSHLDSNLIQLEYLEKALQIAREIKDKSSESAILGNLGSSYTKLGYYEKAKDALSNALEISKKMRNHSYLQYHYLYFSNFYRAVNDYNKAFEHYALHIAHRDSNEMALNKKKIAETEMQFDFDKKELIAKLEFEKQQAILNSEIENKKLLLDKNAKNILLLENEKKLRELTINKQEIEKQNQQIAINLLSKDAEIKTLSKRKKEQELKKQKMITTISLVFLSVFFILLIFVVINYRQKQLANKIILEQKENIELQKKIIETKQTDLLDSIRYAKRIQDCMLPKEKIIARNIKNAKNSSTNTLV